MNTEQLCELLEVSVSGLRSILKRNQLESRLLAKGYELVSIEKQGRNNIYNVREVVVTALPKETWEDYVKKEFPRVQKMDELTVFCEERVVKQNPITKHIIEKTGTSRQTIGRWNEKLEDKGLITSNGKSHYRILNGELIRISYQEYRDFWKNFNKVQEETEALLKTLTEDKEKVTSDMLKCTTNQGICVEVKSYLVQEFTEQYDRFIRAFNAKEDKNE